MLTYITEFIKHIHDVYNYIYHFWIMNNLLRMRIFKRARILSCQLRVLIDQPPPIARDIPVLANG